MAQIRTRRRTAASQGKPREYVKGRTPWLILSILLGLFVLFAGVVSPLAQWSSAEEWTQTECRVIHAGVVQRGEGLEEDVRYTWTIGGRSYEGDRVAFGAALAENVAVEKKYPPGLLIPCWVDRDRPDRAVLDRSFPKTTVLVSLLLFGMFTAGGVAGLLRRRVYVDELHA